MLLLRRAPRNDVRRKLERRADKVPPGLRNDPHAVLPREVLLDRLAQDGRDRLKVVVLEPAADVEEVALEPLLFGDVERPPRAPDGVSKEGRVRAPAPDVEADARDADPKRLSPAEEGAHLAEGGAELESEAAERARVVGEDAEDHLGFGVELCNLEELVRVVERHAVDAVRGGVADEGGGFAGVGVDDAGGGDGVGEGEDGGDLGLGGAVEAEAHRGEELEDMRVGVALDG